MSLKRVAIGANLREQAWGGGNAALMALKLSLINEGIEVFHDLGHSDIDIILLTEPRKYLEISAFNHQNITRYLLRKKNTLVVHRINECDERKMTTGVNQQLIRSNFCADHTVFVSSWLRELLQSQGLTHLNNSVIRNGSDTTIFQSASYKLWRRDGPLKLVTHHWSSHWMKGFEIYKRLDELLDKPEFRQRYSFTYIGNLPEGFSFRNTTVMTPRYGKELVSAIQANHVYLTASMNEPGGNHQNEGALLGLPILYLSSGCLPEYCKGYGVPFVENEFQEKLQELTTNYEGWVSRMESYPNTAKKMCEEYLNLFHAMVNRRGEYLNDRQLWKKPVTAFRTILGLD